VLFSAPEDLVQLEIELGARAADNTDPLPSALAVGDVTWEAGADGRLRVSGSVRNDGAEVARAITVGVLLRGRDGDPLVGLYLPDGIEELAPGASAPFETDYPAAPPIDPDDIDAAEAVAFEAP
jgi:hypothetical protein